MARIGSRFPAFSLFTVLACGASAAFLGCTDGDDDDAAAAGTLGH